MASDIKAAQRELTASVMGRSGVEGTAIGQKGGKPCLTVYVSSPEGAQALPREIKGFPVVVEKTGGFRRL